MSAHAMARPTRRLTEFATRATAAVGLCVDGYLHAHLASTYDAVRSATVSQGTLFRVEAVAAFGAAVAVLISARLVVVFASGAVAAGGLGALLLYRYVDVGAIGPLPAMYEPVWYHDKTICAMSQLAAASALACLVVMNLVRRRRAA